MPLSAVCLNHAGSLDAREAAMSSLDFSILSASGVSRGDRAAFSAATRERGRLPLDDFGRCCHDSVPDRPNDVGDSCSDILPESVVTRGLIDDGVACLSRLVGVEMVMDFSGLMDRARSATSEFCQQLEMNDIGSGSRHEYAPARRAALSSLPLAISCSSCANRAASSRSRCSPNSRIFLTKSAGEISSCLFDSETDDMVANGTQLEIGSGVQSAKQLQVRMQPLSLSLSARLDTRARCFAQGHQVGLGRQSAPVGGLRAQECR